MRNPLVIYHGPTCNDGFGAALVVWLRMPEAEFKPMNYGKERDEFFTLDDANQPQPEHLVLCRDRDIYIVDFSFRGSQLDDIAKVAATVTLLDHHKTAEDELFKYYSVDPDTKGNWAIRKDNLIIQFKQNKSGAVQTWDYLFTEDRPMLINCIGRYDLWQFNEGDEVDCLNLGLNIVPREFRIWNDLLIMDNCAEIINKGSAILEYMNQRMGEIEQHVKLIHFNFDTEIVPFVNAPYFLASRFGNHLARKYPSELACIYSIKNDGKVILSFRSTNGRARKYAQDFGGGGHDNAAGAEISMEVFLDIMQDTPKPTLIVR